MRIAQVWVEHPIFKLDTTFSYVAIDGCERGKRVRVPFNTQSLIGFVEQVEEVDETMESFKLKNGYGLKPVLSVLDEKPLFNDELFSLGKWMAYQTISPTISCFQAMLPSKIKPATNKQKIKMEKWVRVANVEMLSSLNENRKKIVTSVMECQPMRYSQYLQFGSAARTLVKLGFIEVFEKEAVYQEDRSILLQKDKTLTKAQQRAFDEILSCKENVVLLHGATGSGKTEIYLQLAKKVIVEKGKQVLILVPEISLTPQMVERVESRFGTTVAIYHSGLNDQQKYEQYQRVINNEVSIVVGTRSSVFMPFTNLGLIVVDEEHDGSYKQDSTPQYHCRDVAIYRAETFGCKVILGSATPSLESYSRAYKGIYRLVTLSERVNQNNAECILVDMKQSIRKNHNPLLSDTLIEAIDDRLDKKQQVILLLNRRGYNPVIRCGDCFKSVECPHCDIALTYHKSENLLKCHTCGYTTKMIQACPSCGSKKIQLNGAGTQRLEEMLQARWPESKIVRMDADTTSKKGAHEALLEQFGNKEADILIGTQMIAKGLDFSNVTLVGILNADAMLARNDYRSVESTFDLITQAAGRSGRGELKGQFILQSYDTDHYAIVDGANQDYLRFFKEEMNYRHAAMYPPYSYLISVVFSNKNQQKAQKECQHFKELINGSEYKVLGPGELIRLKDYYRYRLVLKGKELELMRSRVSAALEQFRKERISSDIKIDVNPMSLE